ncbi:MAG: high-affinity branched-chain amino acid ABC transporter substrate-binding protein [Methylobacteriaceae bacterium]|nr:high-affinity branched-chain amino acid ABC transporter substrate-binding protein [Methylobacteriaceae bacterium]
MSAAMLCTSVAYAQDTLKIAFVGPRTGALTQYGDMVKEGLDTAIEELNAAGGINGKKIELVVEDDACDPKQGAPTANRVVSAGIGYVVGHVCSGATIAAADIYDEEGVVMITPSATSPALTDDKKRTTIFRTIGRDDQQGPAAVAYIVKHGGKKVAVLHDKQAYGLGVATGVKEGLEKAGIAVALFEGINAGESDYSAIVTKIKSEGVDYIYYGGYHPEFGLIARQARERGVDAKMISDEGTANAELVQIAGPASEGLMMTVPKDFSGDPANAEVVKHFKDAGRDPGGAFQLSAYTAVLAIRDGIAKAGTEDPVKVAEALRTIKVKSPLGEIGFNEKGDLTDFSFVVVKVNKDGSRSEAE